MTQRLTLVTNFKDLSKDESGARGDRETLPAPRRGVRRDRAHRGHAGGGWRGLHGARPRDRASRSTSRRTPRRRRCCRPPSSCCVKVERQLRRVHDKRIFAKRREAQRKSPKTELASSREPRRAIARPEGGEQLRLLGPGPPARCSSFTRSKPRICSGRLAISTAIGCVSGDSPASRPCERSLVLADQLPLAPPVRGPAEGIEGRAAQELELREQAEPAEHPGPEDPLARAAGVGIARIRDLRREMQLDAVPALELALELPAEGAVRPEPRDLVLVLVGEQLEVVTRDRLGEAAASGRALALARRHALDQLAVAARVGRALVRGQELARAGPRSPPAWWRAPPRPGAAPGRAARSTAAKSCAASLPKASARRFVSTARPLSSIARSSAPRPTGSRPSWSAYPSRNRFAAIASPSSAVASSVAGSSRQPSSPALRRIAVLHRAGREVEVGVRGEVGGGRDVLVHDRQAASLRELREHLGARP